MPLAPAARLCRALRPPATSWQLPPGGDPPTPAGALRLHTYVLLDSPSIISVRPLLAAGWKFTLDAAGRGCSVRVPGVSRAFPLRRDASGAILITLVASSRGLLLRSESLAHRFLVAYLYDFTLDTGAEVCIVGAGSITLLREIGTLPPWPLRAWVGLGRRRSTRASS